MTPDDFRRLALSQRKAVEVYRWGHLEFCVSRRSFASLAGPADSVATVQLNSEQQALFVDAAPRIFVPGPGVDLEPPVLRSRTLTRQLLKAPLLLRGEISSQSSVDLPLSCVPMTSNATGWRSSRG